MGGVLSRSQKMFSLLLLPSAALAWAPAPGIPLERQIPVNRQTTGAGSGSGSGCDFEPWTQECNATQIWCDSGYYNDYTCWYGNYCLDQVSSWDGCPGVCHMPCNWDTEECNSTEIHCDAGYDSDFCWYGNYCINQVNEWDGCHGVCSVNCNWETEDWCDMGTDLNGCWMGNWCQDKSMGGCPAPIGGSELNSGEDICAHMTYTEECSDSQISCDSGYSYEGCWFGNYCIDSVNSWDNCPGMCST